MIEELERRVLAKLAKEAQHATQLKAVKPIIDRLVASGHARRFVEPPATVPLWVEITPKGKARLERFSR